MIGKKKQNDAAARRRGNHRHTAWQRPLPSGDIQRMNESMNQRHRPWDYKRGFKGETGDDHMAQ